MSEKKISRVEEMIESGFVKPELPRRYLGVSIMGKECPRQIWYMFRWYFFEQISPRKKRLFSRGHNEEPLVHKDLKSIGIKIKSTQESATEAEGHISGHNDGILLNVPDDKKTKFLNEIKTSADKYFNALKRIEERKADNQVSISLWSMTYYIQAVVYMHLFKLKKCLYVVVNKNTDERFYEIFPADKKTAKHWLQRAVDIINSQTPPDRMLSSYFKCGPKWCSYHFICRQKHKPNKTCRSCQYSEPVKNGEWFCSRKKKSISYKKQLRACSKYSTIKG